MGLRFRKSIKVGKNARINLSKSGVGFSVGTKGARVTKKAGGGTRTTLSVPGTGISYVKDSKQKSDRNSKSSNVNKEINVNNTGQEEPRKRRTWLWVLGWIFMFPIPLTILMLRNQKLNKAVRIGIIAVAWIVFLAIATSGGKGEKSTNERQETSTKNITEESKKGTEENDVSGKINSLTFTKEDEVTVKIGESTSPGSLEIDVNSKKDIKPEDVVFVSENPNVAEIRYLDEKLGDFKFEIIGVDSGDTYVFAKAADNENIQSDKIHVIVPEPIRIESIDIGEVKTELLIGETETIKPTISPENAENKNLLWSSSDETVATVDEDGNVVAVGGGITTIRVASTDGVEASIDINVDASKRLMNVKAGSRRNDDNHIGDEWNYYILLNGERPYGTIGLTAGETLTFEAEFTESDEDPDIGSASTEYTVTEEDLVNGFEISFDVTVTENGGRNSGQSAVFTVTYTFSPI